MLAFTDLPGSVGSGGRVRRLASMPAWLSFSRSASHVECDCAPHLCHEHSRSPGATSAHGCDRLGNGSGSLSLPDAATVPAVRTAQAGRCTSTARSSGEYECALGSRVAGELRPRCSRDGASALSQRRDAGARRTMGNHRERARADRCVHVSHRFRRLRARDARASREPRAQWDPGCACCSMASAPGTRRATTSAIDGCWWRRCGISLAVRAPSGRSAQPAPMIC